VRRVLELSWLLSRKLCRLLARLPAGEFGRELGQELGLGLWVELRRGPCMWSGKESDKQSSLLLAK
jgi:hypothetical protein